MAPENESVTVGVIRDLTQRLERYEKHADAEREELKRYVEQLLFDFRKNVHESIGALQLNDMDHRRTHDADRIERSNRQLILNIWLGLLTVLLVVNLVLSVYWQGR